MKVTGMSVLAFAGVSSAFHVPSAPRTATRSSSTKLHITAQRTAEEAKEALIAIGGFDVETAKKPLDPLNFAMWVDPVKLREYETIYGMFDATDVTSPHGLEAIQQASPVAIAQIVAACGIVEANKYKHAQSGSEKPFYDPFMLWPKTEAKQEQMKMRELKNGRLAMLAWASFVSAALIPGSVPDFAIPF